VDAQRPATDAQAVLALVRRLALAAVVAATAGCALAEPSQSPIPTRRPLPAGVVALPDNPPCEAVAEPGIPCVIVGHAILGDLHERDGCVWIVMDGSRVEAQVVWPYGYSARFDPFTVFDNAGKVVASDGDQIYGDGWGPTAAKPDTCGRDQQISLIDDFEINLGVKG
jgi:hypothetical protein